jgi:hypothetical protein
MSIEDLERDLQITFHDSLLREWSVDLSGRVATFALDVWIGDPDAKEEALRELRRSAVLRLDGVQYVFVDPPDARYPYRDPDAVQIDVCGPDPEVVYRYPTPDGGFAARVYVVAWNAFIHLSAMNAGLTWIEDPWGLSELGD